MSERPAAAMVPVNIKRRPVSALRDFPKGIGTKVVPKPNDSPPVEVVSNKAEEEADADVASEASSSFNVPKEGPRDSNRSLVAESEKDSAENGAKSTQIQVRKFQGVKKTSDLEKRKPSGVGVSPSKNLIIVQALMSAANCPWRKGMKLGDVTPQSIASRFKEKNIKKASASNSASVSGRASTSLYKDIANVKCMKLSAVTPQSIASKFKEKNIKKASASNSAPVSGRASSSLYTDIANVKDERMSMWFS